MANPGDTKERFGRSYIYLIPSDNNFEPGTWRLRVDDNGTPPIDGGGGGEAASTYYDQQGTHRHWLHPLPMIMLL